MYFHAGRRDAKLDDMSDAENHAGYIRLKGSDLKGIEELLREFMGARRLQLESMLSMTDRAIRSNEGGAHHYERLIILDGGTIALSLTLLGALISHSPGGLPRVPFLLLVCPAWALLLVSIYCCVRQIARFHSCNKSLIEQAGSLFSDFHLQYFGILMDKAANVMKGEIQAGTETLDLSDLFSKTSEWFTKAAKVESDKFNALVQKMAEDSQRRDREAVLATQSMFFAFILLCAFAVVALGIF